MNAVPETVKTQSPGAVDVRAQGASVVQVESSKLLPWLFLCALLSGIALAFSICTVLFCLLSYRELERENRLMQQSYNDMKVEFLSRGMNPHPHMPGESK